MPRLSQEKIFEIIIAHDKGMSRSANAKKHECDPSTVKYHVEKFEGTYGTTTAVYALVQPKQERQCQHPSLKCSLCGVSQDNIRRRELEEINRLRSLLISHGIEVD